MVNCFLLVVSALRGVPPVSLQLGKQLCRLSSAVDSGLSLGPPSRKPLKLGPESNLRPIFFPRRLSVRTRLARRDTKSTCARRYTLVNQLRVRVMRKEDPHGASLPMGRSSLEIAWSISQPGTRPPRSISTTEALLVALFASVGVDRGKAQSLAEAIADFRDTDNLPPASRCGSRLPRRGSHLGSKERAVPNR